MKVAMKRFSLIQWGFRVAAQLILILLCACSNQRVVSSSTAFIYSRRVSTGRINNNLACPPPPPPPVKLNTAYSTREVIIDNGIVSLNLSRPEGYINGIYTGVNNLLDSQNAEYDRGYFDVVWNDPEKPGLFDRVKGTIFSVIVAKDDIVEVSFLRTWTASMTGSSVPINIDQRYILQRGDSGFYSYVIFDRPPGLPAVEVYQIRNVYKLDENRFHYMAISDTRQRKMPTKRDRGTGKILAYPEAVLITNSSDPEFIGEVDDKYEYSSENKDSYVHGWITQDDLAPQGFWLITPSNEFRSAGPIRQELTSHVGPTTLSMFKSTHYGGKGLNMTFGEGETYKKVFGPIFIYLNSVPNKAKFQSLWSNAVAQLSNEVKKWPYDFVGSKDFLPTSQRGTVSGLLKVQDGEGKAQPAINAYVGLALPGPVGSWQNECKGYQFWTQAGKDGQFSIRNIVPGEYNLYAWVPGFIGDYRYQTKITIMPGSKINLKSVVYIPPRNGATLWEIGIPDRSAAEFFVPDPEPHLTNKLYLNLTADKVYIYIYIYFYCDRFRQYGLWERYTELYPKHDLIYNVGVSDYHKDWFFAQVTRSTVSGGYVPTTWQIQFNLQNIIKRGNYTLQVALASATYSRLEVRFNDPNVEIPHFSTGTLTIGDDNAIARHGIHGLYTLYSIVVGNNHLLKGMNTIYLTQAEVGGSFVGVMYDYIRLEYPPT